MLIVISPAKTLDFESSPPTRKHTQPQFLSRSKELNAILREYSPQKLEKLMSISSDLAGLNAERNRSWQPPFSLDNAKQALFAFRGDVYTGLEADSLDQADLGFAQKHLRILSGLYGLLRPLDLIQPYRLEMGTRLPNPAGRNLYSFWDESLTQALNKAMQSEQDQALINLASDEYFSAVKPGLLQADIVTPVFRDFKNGQYKVISFYAKKARGMMANWIIRERVEDRKTLTKFSGGGYRYSKSDSDETRLVFTRKP